MKIYIIHIQIKEKIIRDLKSNYNKISKQINMLKGDIDKIDLLVSDLQKSLKYITEKELLGLKGTCNIEKQLCQGRIKSFFRRNKRSI